MIAAVVFVDGLIVHICADARIRTCVNMAHNFLSEVVLVHVEKWVDKCVRKGGV
jgi:hypothetical protein